GGGGTGQSAEIWTQAWTVMLSQMLASVVGLVDIAMVGRLGAAAQAAVGYAAQLFFLAQSALFALGFACVALMARAIGAGDAARARRAFAASMTLAVAVAALLAAAVLAAPERLLALLAARPEVIARCVPYLQLVMASSLLLALTLTVENALRADRDTRTPMRVAIAVTAAKIGLNVLLIFGVAGFPRLELVGAGLATLLAQLLGVALLGGVVLRRRPGSPTALRPRDFRGLGRPLPALVRIALPGVGERVVMNLAMLSYFAFLGSYGTVAAAAYTIGIRILSFSWIPGIGYSQAVATLVGQALGARDPDAARLAGRRAARLAIATAIGMGLLGGLLREPLARLFTVDPETIGALGPFMLCLAIAQPAMQLHFTLAGMHRGAGDTTTPLLAALLGNWAVRVPLAWALAHPLGGPLVSLWVVLILDHVTRAVWLGVAFRRERWLAARGLGTG
ncbi:MAG: MATE family efflux transporter, partial [Myxococcota bacterium]|nr:MATE family efflux transporter [Myxococcota bacterium]